MLNNSFFLITQYLRQLRIRISFVVTGIGLVGYITYPPPTIEASDASIPAKPKPRVPISSEVEVQPGEGLKAIAKRHGLDYKKVADWNNIPSPYTLFSGQKLRLSPPCSGPACSGPVNNKKKVASKTQTVQPNPSATDKNQILGITRTEKQCGTTQNTTKTPTPGPIEKEIGHSEDGLPIVIRFYGSGSGPLTLVVGGIHGDEDSAIKLIKQFIHELDQDDSKVVSTCRVAVIPQANPDGVVLHTRTNSRGVDLNRNFDTKNWTSKQPNKKQRYNPGTSAGSESETQVLMQAIADYNPARIIVPHSPLKLINFDGPAEDLAQEMSHHTGYKVVASIGYPTPGSIGTYVGIDRRIPIPIITLELPPNPSPQEMKKSLDAVYAVVNYKKCQK